MSPHLLLTNTMYTLFIQHILGITHPNHKDIHEVVQTITPEEIFLNV